MAEIHDIIKRIDEELVLTGNRYNDESAKYLITGELIPNESEKRLINDTIYLLRKIKLLENVLELQLEENGNMMNNLLQKQTTIDKALECIETIGVK